MKLGQENCYGPLRIGPQAKTLAEADLAQARATGSGDKAFAYIQQLKAKRSGEQPPAADRNRSRDHGDRRSGLGRSFGTVRA